MSASKGSASDHVEYTPSKDDDTKDIAGRMPACLVTLSSEERNLMEKKLVRKIDLRLLIMMVVMYILNYLDRNNHCIGKTSRSRRGSQSQGRAVSSMSICSPRKA
jgi:hypothetical protein